MISTWHVNFMDFKIHQNKENGNVFYNIIVVERLLKKFTNILSYNVLKGVQYEIEGFIEKTKKQIV
jgi:hypothetical protein